MVNGQELEGETVVRAEVTLLHVLVVCSAPHCLENAAHLVYGVLYHREMFLVLKERQN